MLQDNMLCPWLGAGGLLGAGPVPYFLNTDCLETAILTPVLTYLILRMDLWSLQLPVPRLPNPIQLGNIYQAPSEADPPVLSPPPLPLFLCALNKQ